MNVQVYSQSRQTFSEQTNEMLRVYQVPNKRSGGGGHSQATSYEIENY